jgi:predicted nucleotidyltransferase component of viral defense system
MSLFDDLVDQALRNKSGLSPLRFVVEKELLHHDIMRVLSATGLLARLCFIGGTCLRTCFGSTRLSEDLDFTGGSDFSRDQLSKLSSVLVEGLKAKYGLAVKVTEPVRDEGNVDTWKLKVQTRAAQRDIRAQLIHIDVCSIPSYQVQPMMLLNPYGIDMGTDGLILRAQSREEIYADKLVAFALRPNRIKSRDLWDIGWLNQQQIKPALQLIPQKLKDHQAQTNDYLDAFTNRVSSLKSDPEIASEFRNEMIRFLPDQIVKETIDTQAFWEFLCELMQTCLQQVTQATKTKKPKGGFKM